MSLLKTLHPSHFLAALLIAAAISNATEEQKISMYPRVQVKEWDRLPETAKLLQARCRSKDDDLGYQVLKTDMAYEWSFVPNWAGTTLYSCVVAQPYDRVGFKAYDFERDHVSKRCITECIWNARPDGLHGFNEFTKSDDIFYPWEM